MRPHRQQPTRLPRPWNSPGKNTGVGCHFFLQCMKMKSESEVAQSCPTLNDTMDCSLPGSSIHGIFQARVLKATGVPLPSPTQSAVSQKGKDKHRILTHMYIYMESREVVLMILCAVQQGRYRHKEQDFGLSARRRGWDDLRE